ncbi:hypothetical protein HFD88_002432 [Aspergillus terreus]|nr:hypothetical protein HFD88_002432 [Aspergillus terreus]
MGQQVSDLFYPDNPNRRKRAQELRQQIIDFAQYFNQEKERRDALFATARDKLDAVLKSQGIQTRQELIDRVKANIKDDVELKKYDEFVKNVDENDKAMMTILDIASLASLGTGVVAGLAWVVGIVSGAVALAAIEVVGGLAAAAVVVVLVWAAISGDIERQKLRDAIDTLWHKRAEAYLYLSRMRILNTWARSIVSDLDRGRSIQDMAEDLQEGIKSQWDECTLQKVQQDLRRVDIEKGSWTNEDPAASSYMMATSYAAHSVAGPESAPVSRLEFTHPRTGSRHKVLWRLEEVLSQSVCIVSDQDNRWTVTAKGDRNTAPEDARWDIQCVPKGQSGSSEFFEDCTVEVLEASHH